jgi:hypothetical protein
MRAKEFIPEGDMHDWHRAAIPGMRAMDGIGQYYELYRFGISMAGAGRPDQEINGDAYGVSGEAPTTYSYTDADDKIVTDALKHLGKESKQLSGNKSREPKDTQTKSPVANLGPVKRKNT